ncbi:MAG: hypothetical protein AMXMBFR13_03950 [Phycisphaerae bacterium]
MAVLVLFLAVGDRTLGESSSRPDGPDLLVTTGADGKRQIIRTPEEWQTRRRAILSNMQRVMGPLPESSERVPLDIEVLAEERLEKCTRRKITFAAEKDDRVPAYLMIPHRLTGKAPAMLCLHQTTRIGKEEPVGMGGRVNLRYGLELAERGYVTLSPDYPNYGDYKFDPYAHGYASATMKGIWNHMRAVDLLAGMAEVDSGRIGCIGHSLGGHNTLFVAVFDERIQAAVTSCGFTSFPKYYGGNLAGWSHSGYMPRIQKQFGNDPKRIPFDFPEVLAAIAPRAVFINAPLGDDNFENSGVRDCVYTAGPVFDLLGATGRLIAIYPDFGHEFPPEARTASYQFLDRVLGHGQP